MLIDVHVHTSKYSECGKNEPESMVQAAINAGLDGLVFTEHNHMWSSQELAELQQRYPSIKLFQGIEVSISWEEHIVVIGLPETVNFYPLMSPSKLMSAVDYHSGTAILAHPFRWATHIRQDILDAKFHAIEVFSTSIRNYMQKHIISLAQQLDLPLVASSDGHEAEAIGLYAIKLQEYASTEQQLAKTIRDGNFSLWSNKKQINNINLEMKKQEKQLSSLLYTGMPLEKAIQEAGLSPHLKYPLENDLDIYFPKGV